MTTENHTSPLAMSDADILNMPMPDFSMDEFSTEGLQSDIEEAAENPLGDENQSLAPAAESTQEAEEGDEGEGDFDEAPITEDSDNEEEQETTEVETGVESSDAEEEMDYKEAYKRLTGTFKANGKEYKIDSPEEAIALMQMGANYNMKMAAIKPNLKLIKTLEANGLTDTDSINFLIDLHKGNPEAINKLLQDKEFDALSADPSKEYTPTNHTVSDEQIELHSVIDQISHTPSFQETANIISSGMDDASRDIILKHPQYLGWLNDHVASGIYPIVAERVEKAKILGQTMGMSYLEAYQKIGEQLNAEGAFNHLFNKPEKKVIIPGAKTPASSSAKRKVASTPKVSAPTKAAPDNVLGMSDEEFEKEFEKLMGKFI